MVIPLVDVKIYILGIVKIISVGYVRIQLISKPVGLELVLITYLQINALVHAQEQMLIIYHQLLMELVTVLQNMFGIKVKKNVAVVSRLKQLRSVLNLHALNFGGTKKAVNAFLVKMYPMLA